MPIFKELAKKDGENPEKSDETENKKRNEDEEEEIEEEEYDEEDFEEVKLEMFLAKFVEHKFYPVSV